MTMKNIILTSIATLIIISSASAQKNKKGIAQLELDSGTIEQQFDYVITKSSKFRDFQLIRKTSILKVKEHTLDSIRTVRKDLISTSKSLEETKKTIKQLETEVVTLKSEIEIISTEVDSISVFGTLLSKTSYNSIVWIMIAALLAGLLFFIALFKKGTQSTKSSTSELRKLENEFEGFRKKALKKEQETMRKLQDEINKNSH